MSIYLGFKVVRKCIEYSVPAHSLKQ